MKYAQIRNMDISNGIGISCSIFLQGCTHHCKGCFNKETWDFNCGIEFTQEKQVEFIELCKKPYIDCISILGGEPFQQNLKELELFINELYKVNKPIFIWSGYTYEQIVHMCPSILNKVKYLIDGKYIEELKDYKLKLRGSANQRVIDVQETLKQNKIMLYS